MAGKIYFGNAIKQSWIKAPLSGMKASTAGQVVETQLLSGRIHARVSGASYRRFDASWVGDLNDTDMELSLNTIRDFSNGIYGDGPFYWVDPFAQATNIMPDSWAAPMLAERDWPKLASDITPSFVDSVTTNNFPHRAAEYETTDNYVSDKKLTLIIPSGYKLHFGWHAESAASTSGIRIVRYKRSDGTADTDLNPTRIVTGGKIRTNTNISGTTYSHVEIFLATTTAATVQVAAMIAQILPETDSPEAGGFISGRGTTGLVFSKKPEIEYYSSSVNKGQIGMAATWLETD